MVGYTAARRFRPRPCGVSNLTLWTRNATADELLIPKTDQPTPMRSFLQSHPALPTLCLALPAAGCAHPLMNFPLPLAERQLTFGAKNHLLGGNNYSFSAAGRFLCSGTRETLVPGIDRGRTIEKVEIATGCEILVYAPPFSTSELAARGPAPKPIATARLSGCSHGSRSHAGRRTGFTHHNALLPLYEHTGGCMELHPRAPSGATHWLAVLVSVAPRGTAKSDEIERTAEDA